MKKSAEYWIKKLDLLTHIEGGAYKETYRAPLLFSKDHLPACYSGARPAATGIYFLLQKNQFSALHKIASDEMWHFYDGDPIEIIEIKEDGTLYQHLLGPDLEQGQVFQLVIPANSWFGSRVLGEGEYALVGCTVAPGFDFADFELAKRETLIAAFPLHKNIITELTRD